MIIKHNLTIPCKDILKHQYTQAVPNLIQNVPNLIQNMPNLIQCEKCKKTYSSKGILNRHLKICKGINNKECKFCQKVLSSKQAKEKHQLTCKDKRTTIINNITNNITNNDNSINITINNFGNENLTYISDEMLLALTNNVDARGMIDVIYFNDSHPENHNIELYSNKKQLYKIYKNNSFSNVMNIDLAHNQMICKMVTLFMDKILEEEDMDQKNSKLHNLHYYNKTKSETAKLLSKHIYSQILSRTLQ
jgi:hypothetical protein